MSTAIVAPTDAQLAYLASLCEGRGLPMPAPHFQTEASLLIGEILRREYHPPEWRDPHERTPADDDAEWLARVRYEQGD